MGLRGGMQGGLAEGFIGEDKMIQPDAMNVNMFLI